MQTTRVTIINPTGLHARPATEFVGTAKRFASRITIKNAANEQGAPVNAKSIIHLLTLGLSQGSVAEISAEGEDEAAAIEELSRLVAAGLGE